MSLLLLLLGLNVAPSEAAPAVVAAADSAIRGQFNIAPVEEIVTEKAEDVFSVLSQLPYSTEIDIPRRPLKLTSKGAMHRFIATEDINPGQIFLCVDQNDILSSSILHPDLAPLFYNNTDPQLNATMWSSSQPFANHNWLVINLLYHAALGSSSPFHSFIQSLPHRFGTPSEWDDTDLSLLEGTSINAETVLVRHKAKWDWHSDYFPALFDYAPHVFTGKRQWFTQEQYVWAWNVVDSRAFSLELDGHTNKVLVPLADMANHGVSPSGDPSSQWDFADGKFVLVSETYFKTGQEVTIDYGPYNNAHLLLQYGFTMPDNPVKELPRPKESLPQTDEQMEKVLLEYYSTQQEDDALLQRTDLPFNQLNAARVRFDERTALLRMDSNKPYISRAKSLWKPKRTFDIFRYMNRTFDTRNVVTE